MAINWLVDYIMMCDRYLSSHELKDIEKAVYDLQCYYH
jgi:hypothetical protein